MERTAELLLFLSQTSLRSASGLLDQAVASIQLPPLRIVSAPCDAYGIWENPPQATGIGRIFHRSPCLGRRSALSLAEESLAACESGPPSGAAAGASRMLRPRYAARASRRHLTTRAARPREAAVALVRHALRRRTGVRGSSQKLRVWATSEGGDHMV